MKPQISTRPKIGRLIWIENNTNKNVVVASGPFNVLQSTKSRLQQNTDWSNGKFKITY